MEMPDLVLNAWRIAVQSIVVYMVVISLIYFVMMVLGYFALQRYHGRLLRAERDSLFKSPMVPRIAVLVPAFDEAGTILHSVRALLTLRYPNYEVVVVNDGSQDATLDLLVEEFRLYRSSRMTTGNLPTALVRGVYESRDPLPLIVIDKENGGKSDALNAGLNVARAPIVAMVDADSILEPDSLLHVMKPFLEYETNTLAAGGIVRIANGCGVEHGRVVSVAAPTTLLGRFQAIEYLRAFLGGRIAYSFLNTLLLISGAFAVFRRDALLGAGGFRTDTVGEDMEMVLRLHRQHHGRSNGDGPYRITFVPEPVSWTEAPDNLRDLERQRNRWHRGQAESLWRHRRMMLNPRYGAVGMFGFPYYVLFETLGPTVELAGYALAIVGLAFGLVPLDLALLFFGVAIGFGVLLSLEALLLDELTLRRYPRPADVLRLLGAAVIENLGLRQLLAVWRTKALIDLLRGRTGWGAMPRRGFEAPREERITA